MTLTESEAVQERQDSFLQIASIPTLLDLSTDPTVVNIGLQSLAGLHAFDTFDASLDPFWIQIQVYMTSVVEDVVLHRSTHSDSVLERLARALCHQRVISGCQEPIRNIARRLQEEKSNPKSLGLALALGMNTEGNFINDGMGINCSSDFLEWILSTPFSELLSSSGVVLFQIGTALRSSRSPEVSLQVSLLRMRTSDC
jgi:hypothetical protein